MKTAISLPDELFASADRLAKRLGKSRSALYAAAIEEYVARHRRDHVSERLNAVYDAQPSALDARLAQAQREAVVGDW